MKKGPYKPRKRPKSTVTAERPDNVPEDVWQDAMAQCSLCNTTWNPQTMAVLLEMWFHGQTITTIKKTMGRGYQHIHHRLTALGLIKTKEDKALSARKPLPEWVRFQNFTREDRDRWFG